MVKQRKEAAGAYNSQNRADFEDAETGQASVIETYLPAQLAEEEVAKIIDDTHTQTRPSNMKNMGKVMGMTAHKLAGKADNKLVSNLVKVRNKITAN